LKVAIVAFSFGAPATIRSNQCLAQIVSRKAVELNALVFADYDIPIGPEVEAEFMEGSSSTWQFARSAVKWAIHQEITEFLVVAAEPRLWRCRRDLDQAIKIAKAKINLFSCLETKQFSEADWYCHDSTQLRTRTRYNWEKREGIVRQLPFFIYKLIAS
jgi:hypothetical protein